MRASVVADLDLKLILEEEEAAAAAADEEQGEQLVNRLVSQAIASQINQPNHHRLFCVSASSAVVAAQYIHVESETKQHRRPTTCYSRFNAMLRSTHAHVAHTGLATYMYMTTGDRQDFLLFVGSLFDTSPAQNFLICLQVKGTEGFRPHDQRTVAARLSRNR
ncbi:hypothetical protein RRF57_012172 [Xylaria bambusicola]|uniref:Uncharacterized protein n=1 Tax=Xylaria bambusicola TaxID=326684 RepID=A0AAN7UP51_9PEZI